MFLVLVALALGLAVVALLCWAVVAAPSLLRRLLDDHGDGPERRDRH